MNVNANYVDFGISPLAGSLPGEPVASTQIACNTNQVLRR